MKLFTLYRITFVISFIVLLFGSIVKASPEEFFGFNGENILLLGFVTSIIYIVLAFVMMYQSKSMPMGEKLIWVVLFTAGLIFKILFILVLVGLIFFIIAQKRLFNKN